MSKERGTIDMNNFFRTDNELSKIESLSDKSTDAKSATSLPKGQVSSKVYGDYYDVSKTITTAGASDPNDFDSTVYNREEIFKTVERNAERLLVKNDGGATLYVITSHIGGLSYSKEVPIYPGELKVYYNIYEIRLRSPTSGTAYRVMEYDLCCNPNISLIPVMPATATIIQGTATGITTVAAQITAVATSIFVCVTVKVRSLGTGTYIAIGDSTAQPFRLTAVGDSHDIDWTGDLSNVYVITDAGNTGSLEYIGG